MPRKQYIDTEKQSHGHGKSQGEKRKKLAGKGKIISQKVLKKDENDSTINYRVFVITNELINEYSYIEESDLNDTNQSN